MKLNGQFEFIGIETIEGKKDTTKVYHKVALMQGGDVVKVFINDDVLKLFDGIKRMDRLNVDMKISIGSERSYVGIEKVAKAS